MTLDRRSEKSLGVAQCPLMGETDAHIGWHRRYAPVYYGTQKSFPAAQSMPTLAIVVDSEQ